MIGLCALIEKSGEINKGWSSSYKQYSAHVAGVDPTQMQSFTVVSVHMDATQKLMQT